MKLAMACMLAAAPSAADNLSASVKASLLRSTAGENILATVSNKPIIRHLPPRTVIHHITRCCVMLVRTQGGSADPSGGYCDPVNFSKCYDNSCAYEAYNDRCVGCMCYTAGNALGYCNGLAGSPGDPNSGCQLPVKTSGQPAYRDWECVSGRTRMASNGLLTLPSDVLCD